MMFSDARLKSAWEGGKHLEIYLSQQVMAFVWAVVIGCVFGLLFDVFRILRIAIPVPDAVIAAQDILYFSVCAALAFLFLLGQTDGRVRFFLLVGIVIGAIIYFCTLSVPVMGVSRFIIAFVKGVLSFFWRYLLLPVWRLCFWIVSVLLFPLHLLIKIFKKGGTKLNFVLKKWRMLLYNHIVGSKRARDAKKKRVREGQPAWRFPKKSKRKK